MRQIRVFGKEEVAHVHEIGAHEAHVCAADENARHHQRRNVVADIM